MTPYTASKNRLDLNFLLRFLIIRQNVIKYDNAVLTFLLITASLKTEPSLRYQPRQPWFVYVNLISISRHQDNLSSADHLVALILVKSPLEKPRVSYKSCLTETIRSQIGQTFARLVVFVRVLVRAETRVKVAYQRSARFLLFSLTIISARLFFVQENFIYLYI